MVAQGSQKTLDIINNYDEDDGDDKYCLPIKKIISAISSTYRWTTEVPAPAAAFVVSPRSVSDVVIMGCSRQLIQSVRLNERTTQHQKVICYHCKRIDILPHIELV